MKKIFRGKGRVLTLAMIFVLSIAIIYPTGSVIAKTVMNVDPPVAKTGHKIPVETKRHMKKKIDLNKKNKTLKVGKTLQLKLKNTTSKKVQWKSSNKKVAKVKKGKVTALKKGKATITAIYKGKKYKCKIKVKKKSGVVPKTINGSTLHQAEYLTDKLYDRKNIIISPASLNMVLGMAANGASIDVKKDLEKYLGKSITQYNKYSLNLMNRAKTDEMLTLANGVWYKDKYKINPAFGNSVNKYYKAVIKNSPLDNSTVQEINQWASDNTKGMVKKVINEIPERTVTILANALLFEGKWKTPFKANDTWKAKFTKFDNKKVKTDMMHSEEHIYYENDYAKGFEKKYGKKGQYSFIAILPKAKGEFQLSKLELESFLKTKTNKYKVNVSMPKFAYDWNGSFTQVLKTTDIKSIFDFRTNPLGNMLQIPDSVFATDVSQACKIIVDEKGTKAAAVTVMMASVTSAIGEPIKKVNLNRPFGYIIMDNTTKDVLFMGKVVEPGKQ